MTVEDLTPEECDAVQEHYLRRWLALKHPKGDRRRTDQPEPVVPAVEVKRPRWPPPWRSSRKQGG